MATSVETLFSDIIPTARQQMEEQQKQGMLLAKNLTVPGFSAAMDTPRRNQAIRQSIGGLLGVDTRTPVEREQVENQELFQRITTEAQQRFPTDRTAQLNYLADQLQGAGKIQQAMKARELAQQSTLTGAQIGSEQALTAQRQTAAMENIAKTQQTNVATSIAGLGDVSIKDFDPRSVRAYSQSIRSGNPDPSLLLPRDTSTPSEYEKALMAAHPNDPAKRSELMQQYVAKRAESAGGVTVNLGDEANKVFLDLNSEGLKDYSAYARGGETLVNEIEAASEQAFEALVGGGSNWISALAGVARTAGVDLPGDFGSLTRRAQIERLINNEVLQAAGLIKGALSDKDLQFLQGSVGSLGDSPEAIRIALKRLANKKRIAMGIVKQFLGETGSKKLTSGLVDFADLEDQLSVELQLQNPNLFGASFILQDGSVNPTVVDDLIRNPTNRANLGDISAEAEAALADALEKRMREMGLIQ